MIIINFIPVQSGRSHAIVCATADVQVFPPFAAAGFEGNRCRIFVPDPQETEQSDHNDHCVKPQSTK